jgi:flagellar hook-length control protein FliK
MMSAKTVTTEAPATQAGNTINLTSTPVPAGPTEFQNVLAGAVPELAVIDPLPTQPLAQLIASKQQQAARAAALAAANGNAGAQVAVPVKPPVATDILQLITDTATLLPAAGDSAGTAEVRDEASPAEERVEESDDILRDWLDAMVPFGVFAPQAGAEQAGGTSAEAGGAIDANGRAKRQTPVSASLLPQAGIPEREVTDVAAAAAASVAQAVPMIGRSVELLATNSQLAAAVVALTTRGESEGDKPSADGWMSALGDLAAKRGMDVTPDLAPRLSTPVHDSRWADAIAHRLVMMAREGESVAQLKLVPVELGPLDIQITVKDSEATVHFGAAHAETRAALEASLPKLRELLSAQGLQLTNASVSQQSGGQNKPERNAGPAAVGAVAEDGEISPAKAVSTSLLDIYA